MTKNRSLIGVWFRLCRVGFQRVRSRPPRSSSRLLPRAPDPSGLAGMEQTRTSLVGVSGTDDSVPRNRRATTAPVAASRPAIDGRPCL